MEINKKELLDLTARLDKGKPLKGDFSRYREVCRANPGTAWQFGVLTSLKRDEAIRDLEASDLIKESLRSNIAELEIQMGLDVAKGAERLIIENVITSWFSLQLAETKTESVLCSETSLRVKEHYIRRLESAQRRFTLSVSSLSQFRKVSIQIQINVAQNHVFAKTGALSRVDGS
jgi:hypothetical protein